MLTPARSMLALTVLMVGFGVCPAADPLSKEYEVVKLGKASTAAGRHQAGQGLRLGFLHSFVRIVPDQ